jgi:SAM-dependent methyltransferase
MTDKVYHKIIEHYEKCLEKHGASAQGMDWPNEEALQTRFKVMLGVTNHTSLPVSILDLGCGAGLLLDHINSQKHLRNISYWGIDISDKMIDIATKRHAKSRFESRDILENPLPESCVDYIVMNGVLTEKRELTQREMLSYAQKLIKAAFAACKNGIAFNVMSTHVDWQRDDLFHWALDDIVNFLIKDCSRHISIRMDYGLYEYTIYLYKTPHT